MNIYCDWESYNFNGTGNTKVSIISSIEALENLISPLLKEGKTTQDLRDLLLSAASLHPLSDKEALLACKTGGNL